MLGHDDISVYVESEAAADTLQRGLENSFGNSRREQGATMIATESHGVTLPGFMKALQSPRHDVKLRSEKGPTQAKTRLEWATRPPFIGTRCASRWLPRHMHA